VTNLPICDQKLLRQQAYADGRALAVRRRTHARYTLDPVDIVHWTLDRLPWRGDESVLDVGCGPADLLGRLARQPHGRGILAGLDLSAGMLAAAAGSAACLPIRLLQGDAQALPFPAATFHVVLARHVLYHVPDVGRAVAEAARLLRPGGRLLATTNSAHTMPQYHALCQRAAARFPAVIPAPPGAGRFSLENGPSFFRPHFDRVEVHTLPGVLRFPTAAPLVDYFASTRALTMRPGHTDAEWQAVLDFVRAEAAAAIAHHGHLDVTKLTGAIVGARGG
jgi:SAM-dependent methyltransferase